MNGGYVMELRDLEYFVVVAEQGNLGRAAEALGLSQPALSKSIARLEDAMEVKLFLRSAKGMDLTAEGSLLMSRARDLRQYLRNVAREVADVSRGHAGHIKIGVGPSVNDDSLLAAVSQLLTAEHGITMKMIVSDMDEIMPALQNGQLDVVFNLMVFKPPAGLAYIPLRDDECVAFCSADHRLASRTHVPLSELSKERWTLGEPGLPTQQRLHEVFRDNGMDPPRVAFESRLLSLRLEVAANSNLLAYKSKAAARHFGARLKILPVKELFWKRSAGLLHREEPYLSPAVRRFIETLTKITSSTAVDVLPIRT